MKKPTGDFHGLVDPLNIQNLLEGTDERKQSPGIQAREPPATVVLPTSKHLPSPTQSSAAAIQGPAAMPPVASLLSSDAMSLSASKSGSGNSTTSAITAGSSFSTPNKKAGKFTMKKFSSPSPRGNGYKIKTPTRMTPTLVINYWSVGYTVACVCNLLSDRGRESYAWKQFIVERIIRLASETDNEDWRDFTFTPTLTGVTLVEKRKEAHGPNVPLFGYNDYPERFLFFTLKCNPSFENTRAKVTDFGNKLLEFFRFAAFPSHYIGEVDNTFTSKKLRDSLMNTKHELWSIIEQAKLRIVEEECLDSFFMDDKIMELVPDELLARPANEWPEAVMKKIFSSGKLPEDFVDAE